MQIRDLELNESERTSMGVPFDIVAAFCPQCPALFAELFHKDSSSLIKIKQPRFRDVLYIKTTNKQTKHKQTYNSLREVRKNLIHRLQVLLINSGKVLNFCQFT